MTDDLVTRLRALAAMYPQWGEVHDRALAAADEIERLRHENGAIQRVLGWPDEAPAILDACEGLDGLDPDTVLRKWCEMCDGRGTIDTSIHQPHVTIHQAEKCPDCGGSGWITVNRVVVVADGNGRGEGVTSAGSAPLLTPLADHGWCDLCQGRPVIDVDCPHGDLLSDDLRALRIGRAVLASRRGGSDDDGSVQDFMDYLLAAGDDE